MHPQHGVRWLAARGQVLFDQADNPVRAIGNVKDVTERIQDKLRLSRDQNSARAVL